MSFAARTFALAMAATLVSAPVAFAQSTPKTGTTLAGGDNGHMAKKASSMKSHRMMKKKKHM